MPESRQLPSSVPLCNLRADQCYGHSNEEATSQIAPQSPTENSKIRISAAPGVSFGSAATGHLITFIKVVAPGIHPVPSRQVLAALAPASRPAEIVNETSVSHSSQLASKKRPSQRSVLRCSVGPDASVRAKPARRVSCDSPRTDGGACRCPTHSRSVAPAVAIG